MASGLFSNLIKFGKWTPKIYDLNTFKYDLDESDYIQIGKLKIAWFSMAKALTSNATFSTMLVFANLPMNRGCGGTFFFQRIPNETLGSSVLQFSNRADIVDLSHACAYVRPNWTGTVDTTSYLYQGFFIGYDI